MIAIAVVASIVAYAWVMGYIGGQTQKTGNQIQIQSYTSQGNLIIYVQNTGQGTVHLKQDGSVYVNDVLKTIRAVDDQLCDDGAKIPISVGQTVKVEVNYDQYKPGDRIKVVTVEGTTMEITGTGGSGGTSGTSGGSSNQPTAGFTFNPASPRVGQNVMFTDTSRGGSGINQWSWNFGDGATSTERNPIHSYSSLGSKTVTLTVTDSNGKTGTATHTLMVSDFTAPTASFTFAVDGQTVSFTDTSTPGSGTINQWSWNFGDGGTSTAQNPTHLYSTIGQKTVTLTITDSNGKTSTTSQTANVGVDAPTAQFTMSTSNPNVGQSVAFTDTSLPASTGTINQWSWVFGDGGTSNTQNPAHSYSTPGQKTITLTVTDTNGKTSTASHTLTVNDYVAPVASFTYSPANPIVDQTVSFTDKSTPGSGTINQWSWNFGSGATQATSTNQNPSATYASEGQKIVSLTVTDSNGKTSTTTQTIQVTSAATPTPTTSPTPSPTPTTSPTPTPTAQVTFAVNPASSGSTNPTVGTHTYNIGSTVPITATANTNYQFSSWTFSGSIQITSLTSVSTNAQINGAGTITANFIQSSSNKLVFSAIVPSNQILITGQPATITVQRQNSAGQAITNNQLTITLSATSGTLYYDQYCTNPITSITISSGSSTATFYYQVSTAGPATLTASATNYASVSTTFTINNPSSTTTMPATTHFDGQPWDQGWNYWSNPPWNVYTSTYFSAPNSVRSVQSNQGAFSCSPQDATGAKYVTVTFEFMINQYVDPADFQLRYGVTVTSNYDNVDWHNLGVNLGDTSVYSPNVWHQYTVTIPNSPVFTTNFRFQFLSQSMSPTAAIYVDNVQITMYK